MSKPPNVACRTRAYAFIVNEADRAARARHEQGHRRAAGDALRLDADAAADQKAQWAEIDELADAAITRLRASGWPGSTLLAVRTRTFGLVITRKRAGWPAGRRIGWGPDGTLATPCWLISTGRFAFGPADETLDEHPFPTLTSMQGFEDLVIQELKRLAI
jgi:hypothetical protein